MKTSDELPPSGTHVGTAAAGPRWPVILAGLAWLAWLVFLAAIVVSRASGS